MRPSWRNGWGSDNFAFAEGYLAFRVLLGRFALCESRFADAWPSYARRGR